MWKKMFVIFLAIALIFGVAGKIYADAIAYVRGPDARVLPQVYVSTSVVNYVTDSTITSDNRILGFTLADVSSASFAALHDSTSIAGCLTTNVIGEASCASGYTSTVMFVMPIEIDNGITVYFSSATGTVVVYYE